MRAAAISNDTTASDVAHEVLRDGGSAVGAALAGFFAMAGEDPRVLFSPVTILVGGTGISARAFDGRCRQPGIGAKRPRGFTEQDTVPPAAFVAIPGSVGAAAVACAYDAGTTVNQVVRRGVALAKAAGAPERAALLQRIQALGPTVFSDPGLRGALLGETGPAQGGLVSAGDLAPPQGLDAKAADDGVRWTAPWAPTPGERSLPLGEGRVILTVDLRGVFVGIAYRHLGGGFPLEEYDVLLPKLAVPTRRGVSRTAPGTSLLAPAPMAIVRNAAGQAVQIVASPHSMTLGDEPELTVRRDPFSLEATAERRGAQLPEDDYPIV